MPRYGRRGRRFALILAIVALGGLPGATVLPISVASAATIPTGTATGTGTGTGTATITGRFLTNVAPGPDAAVDVDLIPAQGGSTVTVVTTAADGLQFTFTNVAAGNYEMEWTDAGGPTGRSEIVGSVDSSNTVAVTDGQSVAVHLYATVLPCFTGTVSGQQADGTVNPTEGVSVQAYYESPANIDAGTPAPSTSTSLANGGAYRLCAPEGTYRLRFTPNASFDGNAVPAQNGPAYAAEWAGGFAWPEDSPEYSLAQSAGPSPLNVTLLPASTITAGTSFGPTDTLPAENGTISAYAYRTYTASWSLVRSSASDPMTVNELLPGTYRILWTPTNAVPNHWPTFAPSTRDASAAESYTVGDGEALTGVDIVPLPRLRTISRIAGGDRFETAAAAAGSFPSRSEAPVGRHIVFIANGANFPDALSAGPAAAALNAPVLLVQPNEIPAATMSQLKRLDPEQIVVVGGLSAVSLAVEVQLDTVAPVTRLAGADRFGTSREIMEAVFLDASSDLYAGQIRTAYVASGNEFADALSAGAAAAQAHAPLLIVNGNESTLDADTQDELHGLRIVGVGGPAVLNSALFAPLDPMYRQYGGSDRYGTAVSVNDATFAQVDSAVIAVGTNFPDALAGGALAGMLDAPLYITPSNCVPQAVLTSLANHRAANIELLGGTQVLTEQVAALTPCS